MFDGNAVEGESRRLVNKLLLLFNKGKDEVVRTSRIGKARLELSSLKRERELVFKQLGEEVHKRYKGQKFPISGFEAFFTEIDMLTSSLSCKERELNDLKGERIPESTPYPDGPKRRDKYSRSRKKPSQSEQEAKTENSSD